MKYLVNKQNLTSLSFYKLSSKNIKQKIALLFPGQV